MGPIKDPVQWSTSDIIGTILNAVGVTIATLTLLESLYYHRRILRTRNAEQEEDQRDAMSRFEQRAKFCPAGK